MKKPLVDCLVDCQARGLREEVGDDIGELEFDATSYSAKRQASEQYTLPSVCLSQARQKSGDQSMLEVILEMLIWEMSGWSNRLRNLVSFRKTVNLSSEENFEAGMVLLCRRPAQV
jgi:hypothetical protein